MILEGCPVAVRHAVSTRLPHAGLPLADWLGTLLWLSVAPFMDQALQGVPLSTILNEALLLFRNRACRKGPPQL
jgi:hypothetical protein